jgi:hypothetical protein
MFKIIVLVLAVVTGIVLVLAATRPDSFRVQRSLAIKAPPEKLAAQIGDFHAWGAWSPYEKLDPQMQRTFGGAQQGVGATYAWSGNAKAGAGRMEVLEDTSQGVKIKLDFIKPFEGHDTAEFSFQPQGESTLVTWAMYGPAPFVSRLMGLFFNMDQMIGKDFEAGLQNLKTQAEK